SSNETLSLCLQGANADVEPRGLDPRSGHSNYLVGNDSRNWQRSIAHFGRVLYERVYPGIDLAFHSAGRDFEYDFILEPGRSPHVITVNFDGAKYLKTDFEGNLVLVTAAGDIRQKKPVAYQMKQNRRIPVEAAYVLKGKSLVGFRVGPYDSNLQLVIDPVLTFSVYQGGTGLDQAYGIA